MKHAARALMVLTLSAVSASAVLAQNWEEVQIETTQLAPGIYMMMGRGGNLGVSVGEDGIFIVDDQYAPLTDKIVAAIREISDGPIRFVINTHWHGDHTGGNENLGGAGALVVAHDNVYKRMSVDQFMEAWGGRTVAAAPEGALPVVTFSESVTFHLNGEAIHAFHVEHAHTDGDAIIEFPDANVVHMGDTFFNGIYPFIDLDTGGSIEGLITAAEAVLGMVDDETAIIAGHGSLGDKRDLQAYRDMLVGLRANVAELIAQGKDEAAVVAAKPTAEWDDEWADGWIQPDALAATVYKDLSRKD